MFLQTVRNEGKNRFDVVPRALLKTSGVVLLHLDDEDQEKQRFKIHLVSTNKTRVI
jgi:hypothetical protein